MRRSERGQNVLETGFIIPILLLLLLGVADIGRVFNNYMLLANATREGARAAMRSLCTPYDDRNPTTTGGGFYTQVIKDAVLDEIANHPEMFQDGALTAANITVAPALGSDCPDPGDNITVSIAHTFRFWMGSLIGSSGITLRPSTTVRVYVTSP
jgi:Flp pilus assembly protein TadG